MSQTVEGLADVIAVAARLVEVLASVDDRDARVSAAADAASLLRGLCADVAASRPARWWDDTVHGATVIVDGSVWRRDRVTPGWERVGGEGWSVWLDDDRFDLMAGGAPEQGPAHAIHQSTDHTESQRERGTP